MSIPSPIHRVHLDPVGGIAGDMFVAALADTFPESISGLEEDLGQLQLPSGCVIRVSKYSDAVLTGRKFEVTGIARAKVHHHASNGSHGSGAVHDHTDYTRIRRYLREAKLRDNVREHALALFAILAEAEASVHGVDVEKVAFHEIGAWDSIVDFVGAAYMIDAFHSAQWTCGPVPIGSGRIHSDHGILPVPAPATVVLLRGIQVIDDGIPSERVTPTGAAILKYLFTRSQCQTSDPVTPMIVTASGNGFGQRVLPGISNVLRCIAYAKPAEGQTAADEEISVVTFEIDDQTAEHIAVALDRIRQVPGVLEVFQAPLYGKKGRIVTQVQILIHPQFVDVLADTCFVETSTLGLRFSRVARRFIRRSTLLQHEPEVRVKVAERPDGQVTAKAEIDDPRNIKGGKFGRDGARRDAEDRAIDQWRENERLSQRKD